MRERIENWLGCERRPHDDEDRREREWEPDKRDQGGEVSDRERRNGRVIEERWGNGLKQKLPNQLFTYAPSVITR